MCPRPASPPPAPVSYHRYGLAPDLALVELAQELEVGLAVVELLERSDHGRLVVVHALSFGALLPQPELLQM